jgi:biopolymer transport protein ExbD
VRIPYEPPDETFPINVTNMIDVFLLLLIFFLVATTFAKAERDATVQLPGTAAVRPISSPTRDLVINIRQDGSVTVGNKMIEGPQLLAVLRGSYAEDSERNVLIRADKESKMEYFAQVVNACQEAGFNQTKIGYVWDKQPSAGSAGQR